MKKTLLFISAIIFGLTSYSQVFEGFENWTLNSVQTLDGYQTTANDWGIEGANAAFPSIDAQLGTYSIRLEAILSSFGDTIFGYFIDGDPDTFTPGQAVSIGAVDSIVGWYKYDIMPGDSALVIAMTTFSSTPSGGGMYYVQAGTQSTWKRFAYYIGAPAADSLLLGAAIGDPVNNWWGKPGSWIQYDNIQLVGPTGTQNVVNHSFENWTPLNWEEPNGWATANQWAIGEPSMPIIKTTDMYAGSFALELNVLASTKNPGDTIWGAATNGVWGNNGSQGGLPFVGSPQGIECYYKYAPVAGDQGFFSVEFTQGGNPVGSYGANFNTTVGTYTLWSQAITPMTPDTMRISIWAGNKIGSQLKIDNIDLVWGVGVAEGLTVDQLVAYPNPVVDQLKLRFNIENDNNVSIRLIDVTGKELTSRNLGHLSSGTYRETFNTSNFASGVYFIEFTLGDEKVVKRFAVR